MMMIIMRQYRTLIILSKKMNPSLCFAVQTIKAGRFNSFFTDFANITVAYIEFYLTSLLRTASKKKYFFRFTTYLTLLFYDFLVIFMKHNRYILKNRIIETRNSNKSNSNEVVNVNRN